MLLACHEFEEDVLAAVWFFVTCQTGDVVHSACSAAAPRPALFALFAGAVLVLFMVGTQTPRQHNYVVQVCADVARP